MRQPEPQSAVTSFLSALADDLSAPPDEMTSWRHVTAAAAIVSSERSATSSRVVRLAAAALISLTGLGTGGVAMAGGLPAPIQEVAADVARAMPLPISIPYPTPVEVRSPALADAQRRPMDGEIDHGVEQVAVTEAGTRSPLSPSPSEPVGEPHLGPSNESYDTNGQDRQRLEPGDDDVIRQSEGAEIAGREAWGEGRSHRDDRTVGRRHHGHQEREVDDEARHDRWSDDQGWSDDERRSEDERSEDDRSDDDRSEDDRSDDDESDRH
ncbi:MAG TPA: hypothetical protein VLA91_13925 [Acidimicrobiia bacterium]|nr:hypothetical protein [Acidimicrobiia bacterium]